jgi:hypothetical protein
MANNLPTNNIDPASIRINQIDSNAVPTASAPSTTVYHAHRQVEVDFPAESEPTSIASTPQPQPGNEFAPILSDKPLSECRFSATFFDGFFRTTPKYELENAPWRDICNLICPDRPDCLHDKCDGKYFIPCLLKDAPLVGNTAEIAKKQGLPTIGKMRSASHVTDALFSGFDIDGLSETELMACMEKLKAEGITYFAFTTFSHGSPDKPGMRVRLVIPLDRPVTSEEYTAAWHGFDQLFLGGQVGMADPSGARLYQQQGTFCCHPSRIGHEKSWRHDAGVASSDALIEIGLKVQPAAIRTTMETGNEDCSSSVHVDKIVALLKWIDPDLSYPEWFRVIAAVFNITHGSYEGLEIVDSWSSGGKKYKGYRDVKKYWRTVRPDHPKPAKIGTLAMMAKEGGADTNAILHDDAFEICEFEEVNPDDNNA